MSADEAAASPGMAATGIRPRCSFIRLAPSTEKLQQGAVNAAQDRVARAQVGPPGLGIPPCNASDGSTGRRQFSATSLPRVRDWVETDSGSASSVEGDVAAIRTSLEVEGGGRRVQAHVFGSADFIADGRSRPAGAGSGPAASSAMSRSKIRPLRPLTASPPRTTRSTTATVRRSSVRSCHPRRCIDFRLVPRAG
jgi:hypothetical protein